MKITRALLVIAAILTLAHIAVKCYSTRLADPNDSRIVLLFNMNKEMNVPTFFSVFILFSSSILLAFVAAFKRHSRDRFFPHWLGLSLIFLFLCLDEGMALHENLTGPLHNRLHTSGIFFFAWIIPYGILLIIFGFSYLRFLIHLPIRFRIMFIVAGCVFVSGAVGFEALGGFFIEKHQSTHPAYIALGTLEESFEMVGIILFIHALLRYLEAECPEFRLQIGDRGQ